jgi:flagellar biogenesis protein FliO
MSFADTWPVWAVLLALIGLPWAVRHVRQRGWLRHLERPDQPLKLTAVLAVGPQQKVVTVQVRSGGVDKCLVLGVTPHAVQLLDGWPTTAAVVQTPTCTAPHPDTPETPPAP